MSTIQTSTGGGNITVNATTVWDRIVKLEENVGVVGTPIKEQIDGLSSQLAQKVSYPVLTGEVGVVDKTKPYGNIIRYGANPVWTNGHDDAPYIQNTIESCNVLGLPILVPHGEFSIRSTVYFYPNTKIVGVGFNNPIGSRFDTYALEVFKPKTSSAIRLEMSGISFQNGNSSFSIVFSQMDLVTSIIEENNFDGYNVLIYGKLLQTSLLTRNQITHIKYKMITGTLDVGLGLGLPDYSGAITDSRITQNYISGSRDDLAYITDLSIATSAITNNYIDFFYIAFSGQGNDGAIFSNNTVEYCFKVFSGSISSSNIVGNDIRHCNKTHANMWTVATSDMINTDWVVMVSNNYNTYGGANILVSSNLVSNVDVFFDIIGALNENIRTTGNVYYATVGTKVKYHPDSGWGTALQNIYIEELENADYTTLPNAALTGTGIVSYYNHCIFYNGKRLRNTNGVWKDMMGVTVSA